MFDVGFWEILFILILALVIIGPERLPSAARKVGYFVGKARRYVEGVRSEVESELDLGDFKRMLHNQKEQINELQQQIKTGVDEVKADLPNPTSVTDILNNSISEEFYDEDYDAVDMPSDTPSDALTEALPETLPTSSETSTKSAQTSAATAPPENNSATENRPAKDASEK